MELQYLAAFTTACTPKKLYCGTGGRGYSFSFLSIATIFWCLCLTSLPSLIVAQTITDEVELEGLTGGEQQSSDDVILATNDNFKLSKPPKGWKLPQEVLDASYIKDNNNDGKVVIMAFGDSITHGNGDFNAPHEEITTVRIEKIIEAGYPLRVEALLKIPIDNYGVPGEQVVREGVYRLVKSVKRAKPDVVIISGGTNDAIFQVWSSLVYRSIQTMVNVSRAFSAQPIILNLPPVCCRLEGGRTIVDAYNRYYARVVLINALPLADVAQAYRNTCDDPRICHLLNLPEGVHPNTLGYDVIGEVVAATLLGIDILKPEGQAAYLQALNLPPGSIVTKTSR